MKRLIMAVLVLMCGTEAGAEFFEIDRFDADIWIRGDRTIVVRETITVTFSEARHGIYREIPYKYRDDLGNSVRMPINVMWVTDESGEGLQTRVSREGNVIRIRIGDADKYVRGRQVYVITYEADNAILFFPDHDELHWNVTGTFWEVPIHRATVRVKLDTERRSEKQLTGCYTGRYGSTGSDCEVTLTEDGAIYKVTRGLGPREGITVAYGFDKGIVPEPSGFEKFMARVNLRENWVFAVPIIVILFMIYRWRTRGRDPKVREAVAVQYEPPKSGEHYLNPAEVGTVVDETLDQRDITATLVGLAQKEYVKIEEMVESKLLWETKDYRLIRLKPPDEKLTCFEQRMMSDLFEGGTEVLVSDLRKKFYKRLPLLRKELFGDLQAKRFFERNPETVRQGYVSAGIVMIVFGIILAVGLTQESPVKSLIAFIFSGLVVIGFAKAMPAKTRQGALALNHIRGFQEFLNRADKDRLERLGKEYFYRFLPYAIALDVVDHWAAAFQDIYGEMEAPGWYVPMDGFDHFTPVSFARSMDTVTSSIGSAMFSAPRGSGVSGGGGGFSGGGGGGGGGGSW